MADSQHLKYTVPSYVQKLFRIFERDQKKHDKPRTSESVIEIGEAISRVSFFYEKIRNAVDYKEEHLLRKNAINRILKRKFTPGIDTNSIAEPLIKELIQAGYIKNKSLPETKITQVSHIINRYAKLINQVYHVHERNDRKEIFNWLVAICSCEIEEDLAFNETDRALIDFMYQTLNERIVIKGSKIKEEERNIQIYISILRLLVRYDPDMINYNIIRYYYPNWHNLSAQEIDHLALHIYKIKFKADYQQKNHLGERLNKVIRKYTPVFLILRDVIKEDPSGAFALLKRPDLLEEAVAKACAEKYKSIKAKLTRTSVRSIIYIFLTKMLLAVILEVPYELYIIDSKLNYTPIAINVIFHPILLFIIALVIHVPAEENTKKILEGIKDVVYDYPGKDIKHHIKPPVKRNFIANLFFNIFYFSTYIITFGLIIFGLYLLHFNILGMLLFVLFLSLVTYFGLKVRQTARELLVLDKKENIFSTTVNFFFVPIIRAGHWLSVNFSKINVFVFFFDVIIEAPFKVLVDVFEDWSGYIKDKREEIYDKEEY
ncbi:MAG: hypothetical protein V1898_04665 [Patescibacteria group bacterium]